jgi:hypothetical protein
MPNEPSNTFGPVESADETRQAQHSVSNDAPTDVNFNAVLARQQAQTTALAGSEFEAASVRRANAADSATERRQILADQGIGKA